MKHLRNALILIIVIVMLPCISLCASESNSSETESKEFPWAVLIVCCVICALLFAGTLAAVYINKRRAANKPPAETSVKEGRSGEKNAAADAERKTEAFLNKLLGEGTISGKEADVLKEYLSGKTRAEISAELRIPEPEVKEHISGIFSKTGAKSKKELLRMIEETKA